MQLATKVAEYDQGPYRSYQHLRLALILTALFSSGMSPEALMLKTWRVKAMDTLGGGSSKLASNH